MYGSQLGTGTLDLKLAIASSTDISLRAGLLSAGMVTMIRNMGESIGL
jgi:hypothetical protein